MCTGIIITWTDLHRSRGMRGRKLSGHSLGPNRAECNRVNSRSGPKLLLPTVYLKDGPVSLSQLPTDPRFDECDVRPTRTRRKWFMIISYGNLYSNAPKSSSQTLYADFLTRPNRNHSPSHFSQKALLLSISADVF